MKWNPFDLIEPAIDKTGELLFPIKTKLWFKLGFVHFLSSLSMFKNSNFSFNKNDDNIILNNSFNEIQKSRGILGLLISIGLLVGLFFLYIGSIFNFIFIETLLTKKCEIKNSYNKNKSKGTSLFLFTLSITAIFIIISAIIFLPLLIKIINNGFDYFKTVDQLSLFFTILPSALIFFLFVIFWMIFMVFFIDISLIDMYKNNQKATRALKNTFNVIKKQKLEALVYLLTRIVLGIVMALIMLILLLPLFGIFLVLGYIAFILYYLMGFFIIIIAIPVIVTMMYLFAVVSLPIGVFNRYYTILAYENFFRQEEKHIERKIKKRNKKI